MATLGVIYALAVALQVAFVAISAGVTDMLGGKVVSIAIGSPPVLTRRRRGIEISVGPIPASSVGALGMATRDRLDDEPRGWARLSLARRLAIVLAPWLAQALAAALLLGPARAARSIGHGFAQVALVLDPTPLVRSFLSLAHGPLHTTFGVMLAKNVAFNLLPLAMLAGGKTIDELIAAARGRGLPTGWTLLSVVIALWLMARFLWAFAHAI